MKKNKLALAYLIGDAEVEVFLAQIKKNEVLPRHDYLIFYKDLSLINKRIIVSKCNCKFVKINLLKKIQFEIFNCLKKYYTIIMSYINFNISVEFYENYKNYEISMISNENNCFVEYNFKQLPEIYEMMRPSFNKSVICVTDRIKQYKTISKWCKFKSLLIKNKTHDRISATFDLMLQKFKLNVNPITEIINNSKEIYDHPKLERNQKKVDGELVTVIMSIYNKEDYYKEAIESILNQSYKNLEIIIVLEYSDIQDKIYKDLGMIKDQRIIIIKNKKKIGFANSLNLAIKKAKGQYIARMDDDDISISTRIEEQISFLKENQDVGIVGSYMQFFGQSNEICKLPIKYEDLKITCLSKTPLFHPTVIFNMNIINKKDINYSNNVYAEDYDLWSKLIEKYVIVNIPKVLYYYRLNGINQSTQNENEMNKSHIKIMSYQLKKFLNIELSFDELQLLNGRIDILGHARNKEVIYEKTINIWQKIINNNKGFYTNDSINKKIEEINDYYKKLSN